MRYFGKVFIEYWNGSCWELSAIPWYCYLIGRYLWGIIGAADSDGDYRHVPRSRIKYKKG